MCASAACFKTCASACVSVTAVFAGCVSMLLFIGGVPVLLDVVCIWCYIL